MCNVPEDFKSDGCTAWIFKSVLAPYKECCVWHDWARRHLVHYKKITVADADRILRECWVQRGLPRLAAYTFWMGVVLMRPWFRKTQPIPFNKPEWFTYIDEYK